MDIDQFKQTYGAELVEGIALERAMKAVFVEKHQALLNVVCDVDTNAGGD